MKKFTSIVLTLVTIFTLTGSSMGQQESFCRYELRELHAEILDLYKIGNEHEIENLYTYKKYKNLFEKEPQLLTEFILQNGEKVNGAINESNKGITVYIDESFNKTSKREITVIDDSTFIVHDYEIIKIVDNTKKEIQQQSKSNIYTDTYRYRATYSVVHFGWPNGTLVLNTDYNLDRWNGTVSISNTSTSGTGTIFPCTINPKTSHIGDPSIANNYGDKIYSYGDYTYNILGTNGVALVSLDYEIKATCTFVGQSDPGISNPYMILNFSRRVYH